MSKKHKNNHYHYAEKFTDRVRKDNKAALRLPRRAVFFAVLMLLVFGVISTTFSVDNASGSATEESQGGNIMVTVRNAKKNQDLALTGANAELASTGSTIDANGEIYFVAPDNWDVSTGVQILVNCHYATYSNAFVMTRIGSSRIFHISASTINGYSAEYGGTTYYLNNNDGFCFLNTNNWGHENHSADSRRTHAGKYTKMSTYHVEHDYNVFTASLSSGNEYNVSGTYYSTLNDFKNAYSFDQTYKKQYRLGSSGTYTDATSTVDPDSATLTTSYWNDDYKGGGTSNPKTITYNDTVYNKGVKTAPVTLTASAGTGYEFDGIYDSGGTRVDTETAGTYSYTISAASTYYARFTAKKYTVTFNLTGGVTVDNTGANPVTTPGDAIVGWASGYTAPQDRYYPENLPLPDSSNVTATGREFVGWYENASCTGTAVTEIPANTDANKTYYAKWAWESFTITYAKGSGQVDNTTVASTSKLYNQTATLSSSTFTRSGYTQVGWSATSNATSATYVLGGTYPANLNDNATLYPVWQLNAPTAKLNGGTFTSNATDHTIDLLNVSPRAISAIPNNDGVSRSVTYTITGPQGNDATVTASGGGVPTADSAIFSATTPGTYTVVLTVTDSASGVVNTNGEASYTTTVAPAANPTSATIYVLPVAPTFSLVVNGYGDGDGSAQTPYKIFLGTEYDFVAAVASPISGYDYEWSFTDDFATVIGVGSTLHFNKDATKVTNDYEHDANYSLTAAMESTVNVETVTIYCRAKCNGQINSGGSKTIRYAIKPLVDDFKYVPDQKIYNTNDSSVSLSAKYNIPGTNAQGYTTDLFFSSNHYDYSTRAQQVTNNFMTSFESVILNYFMPAGPKYFFMQIYATISGRNIHSDSYIHTTVGTKDSNASKPLYFYNKTSGNFSEYQVMCYWPDSSQTSGYSYQIAQDLYKDDAVKQGRTYRVNIPANVTKVQFAMVKRDSENRFYYYPTPTVSGETFSFDPRYYWGRTDMVTLSDSTRVIQTTTSEPTAGDLLTVGNKSYTLNIFSGCTCAAYTTNN